MNRRTTGLALGLLAFTAGLLYPASSFAVNIFGYDHSAVGSATLDATGGRLRVGNLGSSGQDGVSIDIGSAQAQTSDYSLDVGLQPLGSQTPGSYMQSTQYGSIGGGGNQVLSTIQELDTSSGIVTTTDFSSIDTGGLPLMIEYRSGGPNGQVIYSEPYAGSNPSFRSIGWPDTWYVDIQFNPYKVSGGFDFNNGGGVDTSARGVPLPTTADFVDVFAPTSGAVRYSSEALTAGGGDISSFTILSEVTSVPEPSTILLACAGGIAIFCLRRR